MKASAGKKVSLKINFPPIFFSYFFAVKRGRENCFNSAKRRCNSIKVNKKGESERERPLNTFEMKNH
jgi:hypothetical protein